MIEILRQHFKLIYIYQLNEDIHFEDAILQTLFNGSIYLLSFLLLFFFNLILSYLATKYSNDIDQEHQHLSEMKLAIVFNIRILFYLNLFFFLLSFRLGIKLIMQKIIYLIK